MRLEPLCALAREGVRGVDFRARFDLVVTCLARIVPASNAAAVILDRGNLRQDLTWMWEKGVPFPEYEARYYGTDPLHAAAVRAPGRPITLQEIVPPGTFGADPFTGEYLARMRLRYCMSIAEPLPEGRLLVWGMGRSRGLGEFSGPDLAVVREISRALTQGLALETRRSPLTAREREVAELAARGLGVREIGWRLAISSDTVKWHTKAIYRKLGVTSRIELARALT
jgi:DNA-binding CsgD family transcriptional regulator